jgi:hypothetical protein
VSAAKKAHAKGGPGRKQTNRSRPVDAELRRAAERIGIPVLTPEQEAERRADEAARDRLVTWIAPTLVHACDQLGEEIAAIADSGGTGFDAENVIDALKLLWKLRWELGLTPKDVAQAAGGAS